MAECVRCNDDFPIGSLATCLRAPDRGPHEAQPHPFTPTRLDGRCGFVDAAGGGSCGFRYDDDVDGAPAHLPPASAARPAGDGGCRTILEGDE